MAIFSDEFLQFFKSNEAQARFANLVSQHHTQIKQNSELEIHPEGFAKQKMYQEFQEQKNNQIQSAKSM